VPADQPHCRADSTGDDEPCRQRSRGDHGQLRAHLRADVRGVADLVAEVVDRACELLALGLDLEPHLVGRSVVRASRHRT
jgi:hypothetical protein